MAAMFAYLMGALLAAQPPVVTEITAVPPAGNGNEAEQAAGAEPPYVQQSREELKRIEAQLSRPAKPAKLLNVEDLASAPDYPAEALIADAEGSTVVWLLVGVDGRPERCGVRQSSGSEALDSQTCDLMLARAQFSPAKDRRGRPVETLYTQGIRWHLEGEQEPLPAVAGSRAIVTVGPDGAARDCTNQVYHGGVWTKMTIPNCGSAADYQSLDFSSAREKSKLHDALVVSEKWMISDPAEPLPQIGRGPGEVLVASYSVAVTYDARGEVTTCRVEERFGQASEAAELCKGTDEWKLPAEALRAGKPFPEVRYLSGLYLKGEPH